MWVTVSTVYQASFTSITRRIDGSRRSTAHARRRRRMRQRRVVHAVVPIHEPDRALDLYLFDAPSVPAEDEVEILHNARMRILPEVARLVDAPAVVTAELTTRNRLLPPCWGDAALADGHAAAAGWFKASLRREVTAERDDVLLARKVGRGARPLSILGLRERLVYRACVAQVAQASAVPMSRDQADHHAFASGPLQLEACRYVFKTDIAAYYQYIDHERLVDEVVAQTGDDLAVSTAMDLLQEATGRSYGLPQLSPVSDVLAEIYLEPMKRALAREGFAVFRFADDFRVACPTYETALSAWEAADAAARELGLVLNEMKTSTPGILRYTQSLTAIRDEERELFEALEIDELDEPEYLETGDDQPDVNTLLDEGDFEEGDVTITDPLDDTHTGEVTPNQLRAAKKVVDRWIREDEDDEIQRQERAHVTARLLGRALKVFTHADSAAAVENVPSVLVYEPSLTPIVAMYLRACSVSHRRAVRDILDEVCNSGIVSAWQATWVAYVAGGLPRRRGGGELPHVEWLKRQLESPHQSLVAEAALALARRRLIRPEEIGSLLGRVAPVHRPTLMVAAGALGDQQFAGSVAGSELDRLRVAWAVEHL